MTLPDALPVGAVVLWHYDDGSWDESFHDDGKVSPLTNHIALPLAAFHALAAKAARADALATALGDAVGRLRSVVDEVRPHVRDGEDARNLREGESFLSSCDALLDAAGGKGGGE